MVKVISQNNCIIVSLKMLLTALYTIEEGLKETILIICPSGQESQCLAGCWTVGYPISRFIFQFSESWNLGINKKNSFSEGKNAKRNSSYVPVNNRGIYLFDHISDSSNWRGKSKGRYIIIKKNRSWVTLNRQKILTKIEHQKPCYKLFESKITIREILIDIYISRGTKGAEITWLKCLRNYEQFKYVKTKCLTQFILKNYPT